MHDLLIRNALLLDGLGSPPVHGDLAVRGVWVNGRRIVDESGVRLGEPLSGKLLREFSA
ncbi:MAG TPA: hypothetical protein VIV54_03170 [Burkholderiales bacterium]